MILVYEVFYLVFLFLLMFIFLYRTNVNKQNLIDQ